jgi:hypothetical protein
MPEAPSRTDEIAALLPHMTAQERAEVEAILAADTAIWRPLPGPQSMGYHSTADVVGFGGSAGGGKTDLACGKALTQHRKVMIMRREATQLGGIVDRLTELTGSRDGYNSAERVWRLGARQLEFGSAPNLGDEARYQGRPHDLLVFDEATGFLEAQVRFLKAWVRTTTPGQRCQTLMTFNPPTDAEGRWVIAYFAPWLDDRHPNPALPGELRWFATIAGRDVEMADDRPFVLALGGGEPVFDFDPAAFRPEDIIRPESRTFIPSRVSDNPYLTGTDYIRTLQSMPEPLRSQMLSGDFSAGLEDDPWQVIPTLWVDLAMARWAPRGADKGAMDAMGVDVARGGKDETVIFRRHGAWLDEALAFPGAATPDGPTLVAHVLAARRDRAPVHIDVVGWGASPYDTLRANDVQALAVNGAERSGQRTADGDLVLVNRRAELTWRMREALDPKAAAPLALPPDNRLRADLCAPMWRLTAAGVLVESKQDIVRRIGRSPDRGDAACLALIATPKRGAAERGRYGRGRGERSVWAG